MNSGSKLLARITFGRFCVVPHRRELLSNDRPIILGSRAFDVLMALIEAHGSVVSKDALMARVWPNQVVEENNLEVQISMLRAAFGAERALIRTVSRRGYQFTGEVRFPAEKVEACADARPISAEPGFAAPATNLPQPVTELIGRDDSLLEILRLAVSHRLVTLTGAGGIGKTRLALAAAHRLLPQFSDGVWIVELASLSDSSFVPVAISTAVGLEFAAGAVTAERVANALSGKKMLLVLDTCEHVIEAAALAAEALVRANAAAHVITTSRESLRADGEQTYAVPPLDVPAAGIDDKTDLLEYSAVRLFVERVRAVAPQFAPDRRSGAMLALICRQLDGIPLAIELAAARVSALGIDEVASRLGDRLSLLTGGRRTALPRHQTLRATLDWSYELLLEPERLLLRSLGIFVGPFTLGAISAVAAAPETTAAGIVDDLSSLAAKSLVVSDVGNDIARYRLLDTTRAYALEKLNEGGERERIARRHAEYYRNLFERAEAEWQDRPTAEWLSEFGWQIDNLRAALDWAFSLHGDRVLAVALTTVAVPLWMNLSLLKECRTRVEQALAILTAAAIEDPRREMKLCNALGVSLSYTGGTVSENEVAWARTLHLAQSLGEVEYQLCALYGLWWLKEREALALALQFATVAVTPADRLVGERMIGNSYHFLGDQIRARRQFERVIADDVKSERQSGIRWFNVYARPWAPVFLARVLWLQGFPVQAMDIAQNVVEQQRRANLARPLCHALARAACPIALWIGNLDLAGHYLELLSDYSTTHGLTVWRAFGRAYEGVLFIRRGDLSDGIRLVRAGFDEIERAFSGHRALIFLSEVAEAFGRAGQISEGLATISKASARAEQTAEGWIVPELLRIKAELLFLKGGDEAVTGAYDHMRQALDCARQQGALSWELRAATSAARLLRDQDRRGDAVAILEPVYGKFTEGFETADLKSARVLLDSLR
jgi:predicted ATPase/DNA-binding winged helix-turn-helix (wHTH) protein